MKRGISPYLIGLMKENIVYVILNIVVFILIIFFLFVNSGRGFDNSQKIDRLTTDIGDLQKRMGLFSDTTLSEDALESSVKMLGFLIPNTEDYFSVIYALEKLSQKTNFIINSYSINLQLSTKNKLKLSITGAGDQTAFLKFLSEYNFGGGRLITSDKIELNPQVSGQIKIDITFYSKETGASVNQKPVPLSRSMIQELATLRNKIQFDLKDASAEAGLDYGYPRKANPF